jgi:hypothetical protein
MALLMSHGASKATTMATVSQHLPALAKEVEYDEQEFLEVVAGMARYQSISRRINQGHRRTAGFEPDVRVSPDSIR